MILYSKENNAGFIKLNRPDKRNALNPELVTQFLNALAVAESDAEIKTLVITGEGKSFCAGADLEYLDELKNYSLIKNEKDTAHLAKLFLTLYKFPKPVIAAVNGAAIGGGCGLASVCDIVVADENTSKFAYTEVKIGFLPAIVSLFLMRRIGEGPAKHLLLTGEIITGKRAYEIGFVNYLSGDPVKKAFEVAELVSQNSSFSMELTKKMVNTISNLNIDEAVDYCTKLNVISRSSEDFQKGLLNFLNKK